MLLKFVGILLIIAVQLNEVSALKCYSCSSTKDWSTCNDAKKEVTCPSGMSHCLKVEVTAEADGVKTSKYVKRCTNNCDTDNVAECKGYKSTGVSESLTCSANCCNGNLCNASSVPLVSGFIMMTCALLSSLFHLVQ